MFVCVRTYLSFSIFSWIVDVYIQVYLGRIVLLATRSNLDSTSSSSSWHSLFQVLQTPLCLLLQHGDVCCLHVGCDVKIRLKMYQAFLHKFCTANNKHTRSGSIAMISILQVRPYSVSDWYQHFFSPTIV